MPESDCIESGDIVATTKMLCHPNNFGGPFLFPDTLGEVLSVNGTLARVDFRAFGVKTVRVSDLRPAGSSAVADEYAEYLESEVARLEGHVANLQRALESLLKYETGATHSMALANIVLAHFGSVGAVWLRPEDVELAGVSIDADTRETLEEEVARLKQDNEQMRDRLASQLQPTGARLAHAGSGNGS